MCSRCLPRAMTSASSRLCPTNGLTRTAPASSRPPSASAPPLKPDAAGQQIQNRREGRQAFFACLPFVILTPYTDELALALAGSSIAAEEFSVTGRALCVRAGAGQAVHGGSPQSSPGWV